MEGKFWTHVCGVPVQFGSVAELAFALDKPEHEICSARKDAEVDGHTTAFMIGGRVILSGEIPTDEKTLQAVAHHRTAGEPLLRGLCTHRLGSYNGGGW